MRFGEIRAPGGAIYVMRGDNPEGDLASLISDLMKVECESQGVPLVPEVIQNIEAESKKWAADFISKHRAMGVPETYKRLISIDRKRDAVRFCNQMIAQHAEFAQFLLNCDQMGFAHRKHHSEKVPQELTPTSEERDAFFKNGLGLFKSDAARRFFRKLHGRFKQRKNVNAHLLERGDEWHLFWFTYDDVNAGAKGLEPHWSAGDHIHYVSHLWGHDREKLWSQVCSGDYSFSGVHIRYQDANRKKR